jgi:hypothetical protein
MTRLIVFVGQIESATELEEAAQTKGAETASVIRPYVFLLMAGLLLVCDSCLARGQIRSRRRNLSKDVENLFRTGRIAVPEDRSGEPSYTRP